MYGERLDSSSLLEGSSTIEIDDARLGALGSFYAKEIKSIDPDVDVESSLDMDYAEHKNHFVMLYADVDFGGRYFRVILSDFEYMYGKIASSQREFNKDSREIIEDAIRNYHHVLNHVNPRFGAETYNPA